ncbi:unnamed protein product [Clonostachys rhizophaga]|uniref:Aminotransferase class I/classII large domain-containing protein n=1 Tax=Clonostachys rhizophaga TaxID=160324 RepID=A0A9N9VGR7_9HYPO|nr:unnamed protein product [Clonostachys rhizophaga]
MDIKPPSGLEQALTAKLAKRELQSRLRRLTINPSGNIDFSSNSYLSLSDVPELRKSFLELVQAHASQQSSVISSTFLGSGGSRLLDGNSTFTESIERDIATFHGAPAGLLFNSGFDAQVGLLSCLPQPGDIFIHDELIHASAHDGMRQSRAAQRLPFSHNMVHATSESQVNPVSLPSLDEVLYKVLSGNYGQTIKEGKASVFVAVESVYSMDGDIAPLLEIVNTVRQRLPHGNGYIIVDEAHSTGLFGQNGRGLVCELGLEKDIFARVHTFGKAIGASGAIVLSSPVVREYLVNYARTLIYTTAMSFPNLASIRVVYDFLASGSSDVLLRRLRTLVQRMHRRLLFICAEGRVSPTLLRVRTETPATPIIPLFTSKPRKLAQYCGQNGITVRPIVPPTVPKGTERVRICVHAGNTIEEVDKFARVVKDWMSSITQHQTGDMEKAKL